MDKKLFTLEGCVKDSRYNEDYEGRIIVMRPESLKEKYRDEHFQLWLGESGFGCDPSLSGGAVFAICLYDNEHSRWQRGNFLGTIKPEALPDWARLKLSQMKLHPDTDQQEHIPPKYKGYSFLENGRYVAWVPLYSEKEVMEYAELQKPYQHKIMICDRDDFNVMEIIKGELIHPSKEMLEASLSNGEQPGPAMQMNL